MSEISNFWLSVLISQMPPYLMFILASKSTHPVSVVLSSQNAQCFYISAQLWHAKTEEAFCQSLDSTIASIYFDAMNLKVIYRTDITMLTESTWEWTCESDVATQNNDRCRNLQTYKNKFW